MTNRSQSSSLLGSLSCFASGTSVIKTITPNKIVNTANITSSTLGSTSTPPPQTQLTTVTTNKLTTNAIASIANSINGPASASTAAAIPSGALAAPINLKISLSMELLPKEKLYPTPSMQDNLLFVDEFDLRLVGCELIQTAGRLLKLPQTAMATGQVLFHRFYYSKSFVKNPMEYYAMASIFLSSKIEECPKRIRDVMNVFYHIKQVRTGKIIKPMPIDQNYYETKNQVIKAERRILKELGFCVHVKHPHKIIFIYLRAMDLMQTDLSQKAWNYMNDSLRTDIFLRYSPENIVCACIYLSARELGIPLPQQPPWYTIFGADEESLQAISIRILHLYNHKTKTQEELEKIIVECREKLNEEKRRTKEASSILAEANQKSLQKTGDQLIAETISQLKSNESSSKLTSELKKNSTSTTIKHVETITTKKTSISKTSPNQLTTKQIDSTILNTHSTNPYHINNTHHRSSSHHMSRHSSFNYNNFYNTHHHPSSHYHPGVMGGPPLPPPPGYYPGPEYYGQYPGDPGAYGYNENSYYDASLRKIKSSSSLRGGEIMDYPPSGVHSHKRYASAHLDQMIPIDGRSQHHHHHHRSTKSRKSYSRSRSDSRSRSRSPHQVADSKSTRTNARQTTKRHNERHQSTRSRSRSMDSVDSTNRSRSPQVSHSKSKKKKSHHHSHSRPTSKPTTEEEIVKDRLSKASSHHHHHRGSKDKSDKRHKTSHDRVEETSNKERDRTSTSSHHKSSKSKDPKDRASNSNSGANDTTNRCIPIYS